MSLDEKKQLEEQSTNNVKKKFFKPETRAKIKTAASHVGLLATLAIYTIVGGLVFRELERPVEIKRLETLGSKLFSTRNFLLGTVNSTNATADVEEWELKVLRPFELAVQEAAKSGLSIDNIPKLTNENKDDALQEYAEQLDRWSKLQAIFFASTILTTIGYGNVFPSTTPGRIFCILFALVGIPLTLTVIADCGKWIATALSKCFPKIRSKLRCFESCIPTNQTYRKSLGALGAVVLLFLYLACGAALFMLWETHWTFFEGFYFCFVTMTTIGFGDVVPTNPKYMLFCTLYILIGLALTGTIIELVRSQYADSWKKLRGPLGDTLGETLRRLGEYKGPGGELPDNIKQFFNNISMPQLRRKSGIEREIKDKDWGDQEWFKKAVVEALIQNITGSDPQQNSTDPKPDSNPRQSIVQIIIYESSV